MASDRERKLKERERLKNVISQWNANRLDIFWLSEPNEDLEFHGAMRFYFQDAGEKVATKCIRVSSTATTSDVIETLIEKFRPDIRMLSIPEYAIYEIHENGEERKLRDDEKPLLVHLDWHKDDREGRFLLRRMDEKSYISNMDAYDNDHFKRKLSKREKKDKKKREKKEKLKLAEEAKKEGIAEHLYSELPETSFTRSISNPEAVMRRRRQQQLEKRLQQFCQEGGADAGGTLRIFGESLNKDVPYKTLLLSMKDTAAYVVKEILDKYGQDKEDPIQYCLVQVIVPPQTSSDGSIHEYQGGGVREYILDDDDCPLAIEHQHNRGRGTLTFHVRRRPADYQPRKRKKKPKPTKGDSESNYRYEDSFEKLPYLMELNPDGNEVQGTPKKHRLYLNVTEVGCERSSSTSGQYLQLFGPNVHPRHCVIAHTEGIVTVTPSSREAETYVNNIRIFETTILKHGMKVRFGKLHTFRFMNPLHEQKPNALPDPRQSANLLEKPTRREDQMPVHHPGSYETTFDAEGNVETISTHSRDDRMSKKSDDAHSHRSLGRESSQGIGSYEKFEQRRGNDPILPAVLEFWEESEDAFLTAAITQLDPSHVQFKLSPTYTLYMAARYRASTHFRPETTPSDRAHRLTALMNKVAAVMHQVIQDRYRDSSSLAFWLANTSELLNFLKQDRHLSAYTLDAQDLLAESMQLAFRSLITCQQAELQAAMPAFLEDRDDISEEEGTTAGVLAVLSAAMSLLRSCRVNAALTIQMFSLLFHYINMWLFNKVVCDSRSNYCTRLWGVRLKRRLSRVEAWAEMQGLELAADCHLSRIVQAAHLLQTPKSNADDRTAISSLCFRLNSLQLRSILEKYVPVPEEPEIPVELIESVVKIAENTVDEQARSEGREIKLQEDTDLQLPFLLPKDGYSCDIVRGVPVGLQAFLQPLIQAGWCQLTIQPTSSGYWTIYMADQDIGYIPPGARSPSVHSHTGDGEGQTWNQQLPVPEVTTIRLQKSSNGIGLSIVAAGGIDQDKTGIYVRSVVKGGAADLDGRLQAGDQLLKVDGQSLIGVNQEKAAELMTRTGPVITLEVAKQGAIYNGLADLVSKPSPIIQRDAVICQRQRTVGIAPDHTEIIQDMNQRSFTVQMSPHIFLQKSTPSLVTGSPDNFVKSEIFQQWEAVQTLDRGNNKKSNGLKHHHPHVNESTEYSSEIHSIAKKIPSHYLSSKSENSLLSPEAVESCTLCCPSYHWNMMYTHSHTNHSISSHTKAFLCFDCCPICLLLRQHKVTHIKEKQNVNGYHCMVCQGIYHGCPELTSENSNILVASSKKGSYDESALAFCHCFYCHHDYPGSASSYQSVRIPESQAKPYQNNVMNCKVPKQKNSPVGTTSCTHNFSSLSNSGSSVIPNAKHLPFRRSLENLAEEERNSISNRTDSSEASCRPRRMSERDIPGRLMSEQGQEFRHPSGPGHLMPPRMQSSKSVPSLNSGHTQESPRVPSNGAFHAHEVYNPAYSRTSSTTSIPKSAEFAENSTRARSSNNIRQELPSDARYPPYSGPADQNPPPYPGPPAAVNGRPLSQPNLQQLPLPPPGHQEERHYQNISLYQQPQQQPAQQQPNSGLHSRPPAQPYPHPPAQPTRPLHGSQSSLNRPEPQGVQMPNDRSRPMSTLVSPREQEQYANSMGYAHSPNSGPPPSPKGPRLPADNRLGPQGYGPRLPDHRDFHSAEHLRHTENDQRSIHSESWEQNRPYHPHKEMDPRQHHMESVYQLDPKQRDLIRQEAKMEEMREEVRRREDRERMVPNQMIRGPVPWGYPRGPNPNMQPPPGYMPNAHNMPPPGSVPLGNGPPPPQGPKPRPQFSSPHASERFQRPPPGYEPAEGPPYYQDAAHPQTFSNTGHPSMVPHNQQRPSNPPPPPAVSYRYGPSGYPPRPEGPTKPSQPPRPPHSDLRVPAPHGRPSPSQSQNSRVTFELPQSSSGHDRKEPSNLTSPSPWEREEKEKLHKQRLEEAHRARDEEIMQLESIPYMSAKQEERLRTLRLEREFQRRAEELHGDEDDDDDDELLERAENRERMLKMQEDLEKARQRRLEWEQDQPHLNQPKQSPMTQQEEWKRHHSSMEEQEGRLRQLKLEEVNRKKELEAAKSAEERLLREARRRQDEYKVPQGVQPPVQGKPIQQTDNAMFTSQNYGTQKNQGGNPYAQDDVPPPLPTSPPPIEANYSSVYTQNQSDQPKMPSHPSHSHPSLLRNQPSESLHPVQNNSRVPVSEKLHEPPAPPQRKSSYEVTNQISSINNRYITSAVRNGEGSNPALHPKKVSFHDSHLEREVTCDTNGNMDYINQTHHSVNSAQPYTLDDIDEVLATPQNTQNLNMYNPGATPGVIGAQEVYKDPRQRIEAERTQQEHYTSRSVGPEKLTFKEKMKMFAQETGEPETPKDKVKISRAQRDIETNLNGT